jgi:hypothetical protein
VWECIGRGRKKNEKMREKSGWSGGRQTQMMDTLASREDQRAARAFATVGVLVLVFFVSLRILQYVKRSYILTGKVSSGNHDAQWIHASGTGGNNAIKKVSLVPEITQKRFSLTYMIPRLKTTIIPHFCLFGSCNFHNSGRGKINITRSVIVWSAALVNQTGVAGRHFVLRTSADGFQKAWTGMQKKKPLRVVHRPMITRQPIKV